MIYADTSALAKLVRREDETDALRDWVAKSSQEVCTNSIGSIELRRAAGRIGPDFSAAASRLLNRIRIVSLSAEAVELAGRIPPVELRTLDSLHLASASLLPDLEALLTYDIRMIEAGQAWGLPLLSPGSHISPRGVG
ncbi:MAG: type II toxin-antitoxin system VapC family toxin [Kineosporiaceae bacterium]|nr:type II toxin-antitoxin system VapC family toxin [Aeromicrobium sp.]